MDLLNKQLVNKENQFREMSAQLVNHLKRIAVLTAEVKETRSGNAVLQGLIEEKDEYLVKLLREKLDLFEALQKLEKPEIVEKPAEIIENNESPESPEKIQSLEEVKEDELQLEEEEEAKVETPKIEIKEEPYISDEIDITSELEKLGLVDLVKKY